MFEQKELYKYNYKMKIKFYFKFYIENFEEQRIEL